MCAVLFVGCLGQVKQPEHGNGLTGDGGTDGDDPDASRDSGGNGPGNGDDGSTPGMGSDAATADSSTPVPVPEGSVSVVVAGGRGGRSIISCDDGHTWINNRIETSPTVRCFGVPEYLDAAHTMKNPDYLDCDHTESHTTNLIFHHGAFFKSMGWGTVGRTMRSTNGVDWLEPNPTFKETYLGLVVLNDSLVAVFPPTPYLSSNDGMTWNKGPEFAWAPGDPGHIRAAMASSYGGGTLTMLADTGVWWSRSPLQSYAKASPAPCTDHDDLSGMVSSASVSVLGMHFSGNLCTSKDGGQTWEQHHLADTLRTNPIWDGQSFRTWGSLAGHSNIVQFKSTNGDDWTLTDTNLSLLLEAVGRTTTGALVAATEAGGGSYEKQKFMRSDDGITWEVLPSNAYVTGHPITHFASGVVPANVYCPGT